MEDKQQLKPHCVNLPIGTISEIKRKYQTSASRFIRNAVTNAMCGNNAYEEGYRAGLNDAAHMVRSNELADCFFVKEKQSTLAAILENEIKAKANVR